MQTQSLVVSVCICTFQRNDLLAKTLESLSLQEFNQPIDLTVVVVDNDANRGAESTVKVISQQVPFNIRYDCETETNIAAARNRALDLAEGDLVAMIDDDEIAPAHWLQSMIDAQARHQADVVIARVRPIYPPNAPKWVVDAGFHDRPDFEDGLSIWWGHCGNCLINRKNIDTAVLRFDLNYGLSGGEDSKLFYDLHNAGYSMAWAKGAEVSEFVHENRLTAAWIIHRQFRGGQNFARVYLPNSGYRYWIMWAIKRVLSIVGLSLMLLPSLLFGRAAAVRCVSKLAGNFGQLSSPFQALRMQSYS